MRLSSKDNLAIKNLFHFKKGLIANRDVERNTVLNILKTGEGIVTKRAKHGFYVDMPYQKNIFIHYSDTLNESVFDEITDENKHELVGFGNDVGLEVTHD